MGYTMTSDLSVDTEAPMAPLNFFAVKVPEKPYYSDNLQLGLKIRKKAQALKSRYVQHDGPTHKYWFVFDLDRTDAGMHWDTVGAPAPNIVVVNPHNGHAHLLYALETPVRTAPDGSLKALKYAAAVEAGLSEKLGADQGYSGLICKNPLNSHWFVKVWETELYTLDLLADYVELSQSQKCESSPVGLGRNCDLFERLRKWSYRAVRQGWPEYDRWFEAVFTRAQAYNTFDNPLQINEVKAIAKSVARYTHRKFSPEGFSAWQAYQGAKGGRAKGKAYADKRAQAQQMRSNGMSLREVAKVLGCSPQSVSNWEKVSK